jgi:hypothetical protein
MVASRIHYRGRLDLAGVTNARVRCGSHRRLCPVEARQRYAYVRARAR